MKKGVIRFLIKSFRFDLLAFFALILLTATAFNLNSLYLSRLVDQLEFTDWKGAVAAFLIYCFSQLAGILFLFFGNLIQKKTERKIRLKMRDLLTVRSLELSAEEFIEAGTRHFLDEQINKLDLFSREFLENLFNAIYYVLLIAGGCLMLNVIYTKVAIAMIAAVVISYVMSHFYDGILGKITERYLNSRRRHMTAIVDMIAGFLDIYYNRVQSYFSVTMKYQQKSYEQSNRKYTVEMKRMSILLSLPMFLADMGIFSLCIYGIASGEANIGILAVYISVGGIFLNSSESLFDCLAAMKSGINAVPEGLLPSKNARAVSCGTKGALSPEAPVFRISDLAFSRAEDRILDIGALDIVPCGKYIVTGQSGSGKTTLLKILLKCLSPEQGEVEFRGTPLRDIAENELFGQVAYLSQDSYIFRGSVAENIFFDDPVTDELLDFVVNNSGLADFVKKRGLDHMLEEDGAGISGGERQRILLARQIARNKRIYLLDEPCAGIDGHTSAQIEDFFLSDKDWTVVIVTHELHLRRLPDDVRHIKIDRL